eukprot:UN02073
MNENSPFHEFKAKIKPYTKNLAQIAKNQLLFFNRFKNMTQLELNDNTIANYELFIRIYHQQLNQTIEPSLDIQLLWIIHALNPRQYFKDYTTSFNQSIPVKIFTKIINNNSFRHYLKSNVSPQIFKQITTQITSTHFIQNYDIKQAVIRQMKFIDKMNVINAAAMIDNNKIQQSIE